jgi:hypothetical protein
MSDIEFYIPHPVNEAWPYWQCATPFGPYNFQAADIVEACSICDRERLSNE